MNLTGKDTTGTQAKVNESFIKTSLNVDFIHPKLIAHETEKEEDDLPAAIKAPFVALSKKDFFRIRLKRLLSIHRNIYCNRTFMTFLILFMVHLFHVTKCEYMRNCPEKCLCETFSTPTASSVQNIWPSLLTSSLRLEKLTVPLRDPASFDDLISSILTTNASGGDEEEGSVAANTQEVLENNNQEFRTTSTPVGGYAVASVNPGELSVDCSNRSFRDLSHLSFLNGQNTVQTSVVKLDLSSNYLKSLRKEDFEGFQSLRYLNLDFNYLEKISYNVLPPSLLHLSLENNQLHFISQDLFQLSRLRILNLATNQLTTVAENDVSPLPQLILLSLRGNRLYEIHTNAFSNISELQILDLTDNQLSDVPEAIKKCTKLRQILLGDNRLTYVDEASFFNLKHLQWVDLQGNPLLDVHPLAFINLPSLVKLILQSARDLDTVPSLTGSPNVEAIRIDRGAIEATPSDLCITLPRLRSLNLHLNNIQELPELGNCQILRLLDLSNNKITDLGHKRFDGLSELHDLLLQYNFIEYIPENAFAGLSKLQVLNLEYNRIQTIDSNAFIPLVSLEDINLGNNEFPEMPSRGLERVVLLKAHNNRHLRVFPGLDSFPSVHSLILSYAYHCCPFLSLPDGERLETSTAIQEDVVFSVDQLHKYDPEIWNYTDVWPHIEGIPTTELLKVWARKGDNGGSDNKIIQNGSLPFSSANFAMLSIQDGNTTKLIPFNGTAVYRKPSRHSVQCIPQPGPFMPCRDLFDWWTLRCGVWLVFLLALMGNGVVVIVLVTAFSKMDVPRFLVANLALADFFMGIYLGFLAVVDASTLGDFRMYAIPWQMSAGCQLAGFLGVLSSELSVYTLTVITMERNYAITHAMHLNKRLSLKHAAYIMGIGWVFALTMAVLPLAGISDYRKFAVCLPFETDGAGLGYIVFLMFINGLAFVILMGCYLKIYCAIRGSQAWNSNDSRIAKRMALLVFTDFICWAPIAFFSLTAAFGLRLISLEGAKVFTVFVLPFNSCCNPFLYALLTKQFKKDCVMLCKAIEESRVTRGIGRCRHSSNFSNRQTPVNTNSALDQNSKEDNHGCNCRMKTQQSNRKSVAVRALRFLCCKSGNDSVVTSNKLSSNLNRSPLKVVRSTTLDSSKMSSSWSWKGQSVSNLRLLELRRQATLDLARKSSQESSLSSSRHDSSGTTGSTVTWRISRSSVSSDASSGGGAKGTRTASLKEKRSDETDSAATAELGYAGSISENISDKPRLQRQGAVDSDPRSNELKCPMHSRGDNLSCVYEQASLEEEDSNEVFIVSEPSCHLHRSLSDGLLCGTLLSLSAPTPQLISSVAPNLHLSKVKAKSASVKVRAAICSDSSELRTVESYVEGTSSHDEDTKPEGGLLETHFPLGDASCEVDPLLRK